MRALLLTSTLLLLSACGGATSPANPGPPPPVQPAAQTLSGQVLDPAGQPVAGAEVWIQPVSYQGLIKARTDSQGRYRSIELNAAQAPYEAQAYKTLTYHGEQYCVRMGGETEADFDVFNPQGGAVRNFRWKTTGRAEGGYDNLTWGGTLSLYTDPDTTEEDTLWNDEVIEVTLVPNGPLLDGSAGETLTYRTRIVDQIADVPVGQYDISAQVVNEDGTRSPLRLKADNSVQKIPFATSITFLFDGLTNCGHYATFHTTPLAISR